LPAAVDHSLQAYEGGPVASALVIRLDAATVLAQWAAGGMLFAWLTTRGRLLGIGYGWLLRIVYGALAIAALFIGRRYQPVAVRDSLTALMAVAIIAGLVVSIRRRAVGPVGERSFPPILDLLPALIAVPALVSGAWAAGGNHTVAIARTLIGAAFMGVITDSMLLGHWYLVQPGLSRDPIKQQVRWVMYLWPFEALVMLLPTGMVSVFNGHINDGYGGVLGWFWIACVVTTLGLAIAAKAALNEKAYSAVMAATGLTYLAILSGFGMDLVARAVLAG
jgi:hypothetical protein